MSDLLSQLQLKFKFQSPDLEPNGARVFQLPSGRILLHSWEEARIFDPETQKLVYKTTFEGSMIYPQMDGEVYFRNRKGSGWFEHSGSLRQPMNEVMMAMCGRGNQLYVWGSPAGKKYGFHELAKDSLKHVRTLALAASEDHTAHTLLLSEDGKTVLRAGTQPNYEFGADLWDIPTGKIITTYAESMGSEESPFALSKKYAASIGPEQAQVWDNATGEVILRLEPEIFHHTLHISPSEQYLYTVRDEGFEVFDISDGSLKAEWMPEAGIATARFVKDGVWILQDDGSLSHYDTTGMEWR